MNDLELDQLVASTSTVDDDRIGAFPLAEPGRDLTEAIVSEPRRVAPVSPTEEDPTRRGLPRRRTMASVAAVLVLLVGFAGFSRADRDGNMAYAAEAIAVAEEVPRILVDAPGWGVARANQFGTRDGDITFSKDGLDIHLWWEPLERHDVHVQGWASGAGTGPVDVLVLGRPAVAFGEDRTFVVMWTDGQHAMSVVSDYDGGFASLDEFLAVVDHLVEVDVERWLGAMPASAVAPNARSRTVDEMLVDVPVPDGLDAAAFRSADFVSDRYILGAQLTGAVACGWIESWIEATDAGDSAGVERAVEAMATSHDWQVLGEMTAEGRWPEAIWEYANAMEDDSPLVRGSGFSIREAYRHELCPSPGEAPR